MAIASATDPWPCPHWGSNDSFLPTLGYFAFSCWFSLHLVPLLNSPQLLYFKMALLSFWDSCLLPLQGLRRTSVFPAPSANPKSRKPPLCRFGFYYVTPPNVCFNKGKCICHITWVGYSRYGFRFAAFKLRHWTFVYFFQIPVIWSYTSDMEAWAFNKWTLPRLTTINSVQNTKTKTSKRSKPST